MRARTDLHNYSSGINYAFGWLIKHGLTGGEHGLTGGKHGLTGEVRKGVIEYFFYI
jgi:hypothetical protein